MAGVVGGQELAAVEAVEVVGSVMWVWPEYRATDPCHRSKYLPQDPS